MKNERNHLVLREMYKVLLNIIHTFWEYEDIVKTANQLILEIFSPLVESTGMFESEHNEDINKVEFRSVVLEAAAFAGYEP